MAGSRISPVWLPSLPPRDYTATTGTDHIHLMNSLIVRGLGVGVALGLVYLIGKSMVNDLLEEVAAGLT